MYNCFIFPYRITLKVRRKINIRRKQYDLVAEALTGQEKARGGYLESAWKILMCFILPCHKSCCYGKHTQ